MTASGTASCAESTAGAHGSLHAEIAWSTVMEPPKSTEPQPFADGSLNNCVAEADSLHTTAIYDRATGKGLALVDDYTREPSIKIDETTLIIEGDGCVDRIALDETAKRLP